MVGAWITLPGGARRRTSENSTGGECQPIRICRIAEVLSGQGVPEGKCGNEVLRARQDGAKPGEGLGLRTGAMRRAGA